MRRVLRAAIALITVILSFACGVFALFLLHAPVFRGGEDYELYFGASSSALMERTDTPALSKLLISDVVGESARYEGNRYEEIKSEFCARLLFTEEACGVTNYYLYSPYFGGGVSVCGYTVNLHIAVSGTRTAAGTPLIFGGF